MRSPSRARQARSSAGPEPTIQFLPPREPLLPTPARWRCAAAGSSARPANARIAGGLPPNRSIPEQCPRSAHRCASAPTQDSGGSDRQIARRVGKESRSGRSQKNEKKQRKLQHEKAETVRASLLAVTVTMAQDRY